MPTFEETHAAWIDGTLSGEQLAAFEQELTQRGEKLDRESSLQLGDFLRKNSVAPVLGNGDFFNHQILERLEAEPTPRRSTGWLGIPRLGWLGALSLTAALALFLAIIPKKSESHSTEAYIAQVISARSADPTVWATALQSTDDQGDPVAVVWLDGLEYVPQEKPNVR